MKSWHLVAIAAAVIVAAAIAWYLYDQSNRTLLSIETPGGSIEVNENSEGVSVQVDGY